MNDRQRRFVVEYAIDRNATQAAIRAGYSPRTAYSLGARLLKHAEVANAIAEIEKKAVRESQISADQVLAGLAEIATQGKVESARVRALELLGKYHGLFVDRVHHEGQPTGTVLIVMPDNGRDGAIDDKHG